MRYNRREVLKIVALAGILIIIAFVVLFGRILEKAGRRWWGALVPVYNAYLYAKIAGKSRWWLWIVLSPVVILILYILQALMCHPAGNVILRTAYHSGNVLFLAYIFFLLLKINTDLGRRFRTGAGFGIGLTLLAPVFGAVLAFGRYTYEGEESKTRTNDENGKSIDAAQRKGNIAGLGICSFAILLLVGSGFGQKLFYSPPAVYSYAVPAETDDGWKAASLEEVGLDVSVVGRGVEEINRGTYGAVHSFLIVRYGKLVLEQYWSGNAYINTYFLGKCTDFTRDNLHNLASVTKSVTSALVGIAVDRGEIGGVEEKVSAYFPEYAIFDEDGRDEITIEHLLTMTSGLDYDEFSHSFLHPLNDTNQLFFSRDPVRYILTKPMTDEPGARFHYNSGNTILLGEIVKRATGMRIDRYAEKYLLAPLGIRSYAWRRLSPDVIFASGDLKMRPRDMAKIGWLFLQGGMWNGTRIISRKWVEESTAWQVSHPGHLSGYGYQWTILKYFDDSLSRELYIYFASGYGGQYITVVPELSLVVVITAGNYGTSEPIVDLCPDYVFPAVTDI